MTTKPRAEPAPGTHAGRLLALLERAPGGMTHGELRAELPATSAALLRLTLHALRRSGHMRPPVSCKGGRAPLAQLCADEAPARHVVALTGAGAFVVRRMLLGDSFASRRAVDALFDAVMPGVYVEAHTALYALRARGVLAVDPAWPLQFGPAEYSFED
jgi:hypothetical protein